MTKEFSMYYFQNVLFRAFFVKEMNLVTRASLSQDLLKKLPVIIPPLSIQMMIVEHLDRKVYACTTLIDKAKKSITLLKERRTSLISSAVTGKIDLRNWQTSA